jgi:iron(III) transport system substrate-binding protein
VLKVSAASAAATLFAEPLVAAAPPATEVTSALVEAASKEGKVSFYTALELNVAERLSRTFEAKYPGIAVRVERSGAERIFQRIAQEQGSGINAVDVANSTDPAHYLDWKKHGWLAPYVPDDVARHFPADQIDADGMHATACAWTEVIGYNTSLVKQEDAPKSYADLLDPKWQGRIVKGHPGYSGAIMTALRARARPRLALSRKARAAEGDAGAVGSRSAEEDPARRARDHGRRQRLQSGVAQGPG